MATTLRYALAPACVAAAVLLRVSPLGSYFYPTEPFILGVVAAAWFGGVGPGVFAALLAAVTVPQLLVLTQLPSSDYRLFWGFFDLPRFITLGLTGAAVGWGTSSYRRAAAVLRERDRELTRARDELETAVAERTAHLAASEERYALAMRASGEGHWDWKIDTDEFYASPRYLEIAGFPADMEYSRRADIVDRIPFHPDDRATYQAAVAAHFAGKTPRVDLVIRIIPNGELRWLHVIGMCTRDADGKPVRWAGSANDITARKLAEEMGRLSEERYARAMAASEQELRRAQRLESMGTLAGGIAHDFNNILGAILGYGEMAMREAKKGTRLRRDLDSIMVAGERGRSLIDRILAFSRSGVGERVPVHVEDVVRETLDQLAAKLPESVTLVPRLHAGRAAMLGDPTQIHQVVMNLASNAVQAMPHGGVLRVGLETVRLDASRAVTVGSVAPDEYIVLRVRDSGTGISPAVFERMFDPFFTTKEVGVGSGLGLSLVHGIVVNVGGAIDVATKPGDGSTFTVYLPRCGDAPAKAIEENRPLRRGEGERVLVVDDEEPLVRLATETLEGLGYSPIAFTSSRAALAAFRADPARFDAVLTDERMPGLSGSALIREMRGIRDSIPVVLMSGYLGATPRDARETGVADALGIVPRVPVGVGADVMVKKPLSARDLAASMARALHR